MAYASDFIIAFGLDPRATVSTMSRLAPEWATTAAVQIDPKRAGLNAQVAALHP